MLITRSIWCNRAGTDLVRSEESTAGGQRRTTREEKDTPIGSSRCYRFDQLNSVSIARSTVGRYSVHMVEFESIWLSHWVRFDIDPVPCDASKRSEQVSFCFDTTWAAADRFSCTIPLHLFRNRTVCVSSIFMMFLQLAIVAQTYYWPIYFQSVKGHTAKDSGIQMLPLCISSSLSALSTGVIVSKVGYYVPFMWIGPPVLAVGAGLFQLIHAYSPISTWIGYQIVSGVGYGICGQLPILAVQIVLRKEDVPTGCVLVMFFQCLGGALATSISQNIFTDNLLKNLQEIDGIDAAVIVDAGAADFRRLVPPGLLNKVIESFETACKNVFLLAVASAAVALVVSVGMEWRRIPKDTKSDPGSEVA